MAVSLVVTNAATGTYYYFSPSREEVQSRYPYIDFSRNFIDQKHYLTTLQPIRESLNIMADEYGRDSVSIYVEYLNTGANISIGPDVYVWSASLPKLPIAMAAMKKVEEGDWRLTNELVLMPVDKDKNSGSKDDKLWEHPVGTQFTIEKLLREMLANSDNTAQEIVYRNLHADEIDRVVFDLGLDKLFNKEGRMSAKEYSRFFRSLYTASFLNRENSQQILRWLDESTFEDFLGSSVPDDVPFPHKYGENVIERVYADSGIVYIPNRPYIISVMIQGDAEVDLKEDKARAEALMRTVSKTVYEYISR